MKTRHKIGFLILGLAIGAALSVLGAGPDELEMQQQQYCEMVALHRADPTVGWPDYNESYDKECTHGKDATR
jgi:hypothetical protein